MKTKQYFKVVHPNHSFSDVYNVCLEGKDKGPEKRIESAEEAEVAISHIAECNSEEHKQYWKDHASKCKIVQVIESERIIPRGKQTEPYSVEIYLRNPDDLSGGWTITIEEVEATSKQHAADLIIRKHGILFDCFIEQGFQKFNDAWAN